MQAYRAYTTVEENGGIVIKDLPFKPGSFLEVVLVEDVKSDSEIVMEWKESNKRIRNLPKIRALSEKDIDEEVAECRKNL